MEKGLFITFEGVDCSGKTTQLHLLEDYLLKKNKKVKSVREPGGTPIGEKVRNLILDKENNISFVTEALLYASARAELVDKIIEPALIDGYIVLCDRFLDSSIAYQGVARGLGTENIKAINEFGIKGLYPDVTFFMDIDPRDSMTRKEHKEFDRIESEKLDFHQKVYNGYKDIAQKESHRIITIDAKLSETAIHNIIINKLFF